MVKISCLTRGMVLILMCEFEVCMGREQLESWVNSKQCDVLVETGTGSQWPLVPGR